MSPTSPTNEPIPGSVIETGYDVTLARASVGPGWRTLIDEIFAAKPDDVLIVQVKQKMGALRIYTEPYEHPTFTRFIRDRERRSVTICERCGERGSLRERPVDAGVRTLCDRHQAERSKR